MSEVKERQTTHIYGYEVHGYKGDYIFETLRETKDFYEVDTLKKWKEFIGKPEVIFDIGANLGNHTLYWAQLVKPRHIYAFEPYQPNFENLKLNVEKNGLTATVFPQMKAVGEAEGSVELEKFDPSNFGGTTFRLSEEKTEDGFEMTSVDSFVQELKIDAVDLMKIDTEGFEVSVLKGARNTIKRNRPILWIEVSYESYREVLDILEAFEYEMADIEGFNLLMIPAEKNVHACHVEPEKLLDTSLRYQAKTATYYQNYEKAKRWHADSVKKIECLETEIGSLKEAAQRSEENYRTAKSWNEASQVKVAELRETEVKLREQLAASEENYRTAKSWNEASQAKVAELRETVTKLREQLAAAQNNYVTAKGWNEANIAKVAELQKQLMQAKEKEQKIETECHKAQSAVVALTNDRENLCDQLHITGNMLRKQEARIQSLSEELGEYARVLQHYLDIAPESLDLAQTLVERLEKQKETQDGYAGLVGRFVEESLESEKLIGQMQAQINKLQAQAGYLKRENAAYREKLDKIRSVWYGRLGIAVYKKGQKLRNKIKSMLKK